ncbi:MAG TPA: BolA family transcriptional regulator [Alphaproteobacteria bacterium]|nr:BolA family transcriptional regulator [Alphaproteobacteria bacterium]
MDQNIIIQAIKNAVPDADVKILDPLNDGVHLQCVVTAESLAEYSRIERQRIVNNAIKEFLDSGRLHALGIKIKTK